MTKYIQLNATSSASYRWVSVRFLDKKYEYVADSQKSKHFLRNYVILFLVTEVLQLFIFGNSFSAIEFRNYYLLKTSFHISKHFFYEIIYLWFIMQLQ